MKISIINKLYSLVDLVLQVEDKELRDEILNLINDITTEHKQDLKEKIKN